MPRGRMGGRHGMSTEKAKDFKGTMKKLMGYPVSYTHLRAHETSSVIRLEVSRR